MAADSLGLGDTSTRLRSVTHSLGLIVAAFVVGIVLANLGVVAVAATGMTFESLTDLPPAVTAGLQGLQFVGFILVGLWYLRWRDDAGDLFDVDLPSLSDLGWATLGLVVTFGVLYAVSLAISLLGIESASNAAILIGQEQPEFLLYLIGVTILLTAPAEELIFRGLVQGLFRRAYGVVPGLVIASALFGVVHFLALGGGGSKTVYIVTAGALGLVLGALYEKTQNLVVPMLVHGAFNAIQFYLAYLIATGQIQVPS